MESHPSVSLFILQVFSYRSNSDYYCYYVGYYLKNIFYVYHFFTAFLCIYYTSYKMYSQEKEPQKLNFLQNIKNPCTCKSAFFIPKGEKNTYGKTDNT